LDIEINRAERGNLEPAMKPPAPYFFHYQLHCFKNGSGQRATCKLVNLLADKPAEDFLKLKPELFSFCIQPITAIDLILQNLQTRELSHDLKERSEQRVIELAHHSLIVPHGQCRVKYR
jgi:hypothetical protein